MVRKDPKNEKSGELDSLLSKTFKIKRIGRENNSGGGTETYRRTGGVPTDCDPSLWEIRAQLRLASHM